MTDSWQKQLAQSLRDPESLLEKVRLDPATARCQQSGLHHFPVRVPPAFAGRIQAGRLDDPLLKQVFPYAAEDREVDGFSDDPLAEDTVAKPNGLMQKYRGRILLITTAACAVHCRYCFRRHFPYRTNGFTRGQLQRIIDTIARDVSLREVILSGGDPLMLTDASLRELCRALTAIPHVRRLRIHSRLPIVLPARITPTLLEMLRALDARVVLMIHSNHANEIDGDVAGVLETLHASGIALFNQSVLLAGVNDRAEALIELSERLFDCRVAPCYLHLLDPVRGASHYQVPLARACELAHQLRARLPGYLVPLLVREQAGAEYKLPVL